MANKALPAHDVLHQLFSYNPEAGTFHWKARPDHMFENGALSSEQRARQWNNRHAGKATFTTALPTGHRYTSINYVKFLAHRVAWKMHYGVDPDVIDHINGDPSDNRIANLRSVPQKINCRNAVRRKNNTSGAMGVYFHRQNQKWAARIMVDRKNVSLGLYRTFDEAVSARKEAELKYGFHENNGRCP